MRYSVAEPVHDPWAAVELYMSELGSPELGCEVVPVEEAYGRVLCEDVKAPILMPPYPRSLVDGFAVVYEDVAGASRERPSRLKLLGRIAVGADAGDLEVLRGSCYAVDTGSYVPRNADLVVPYEYTSASEGYVEIYRALPRGSNIAYPGSDVHRGSTVAVRGSRVDGRVVSALASVGIKAVRVYRRPRACVAATGNELQEPGAPLAPGRVYESNIEALTAILRSEGFEAEPLGILRDEMGEIAGAIEKGVERCDAVLITGGTSAGVEDYVYRAIEGMGKVVVRGIKYKPGKPLTLGVVRGRPVIGLPGNPVSVVMLTRTILAGLLARLGGEEGDWAPERGYARLLRGVRGAEGRLTHIPSILVRGREGLYILPWVLESYMVSRLALADVYIEIPYNTPKRALEPLELVEYRGLVPRPRAWALEAGEVLWGAGVSGNRISIYTSPDEARLWLDAGASLRAHICRELDLSRGEAIVEVLPDGARIRYRVKALARDRIYRVPRYPGKTCYSEAVEEMLRRRGVEGYAEISVESPEQAYEMFLEGYLDIAFRAEPLQS